MDTATIPGQTMRFLAAGVLSEEQARAIVALGPEAAVFVILELSKQLAEQRAKVTAESHQTPATPSGMKPPYQKPPPKSRKKRPGAKPGHPGRRRKAPERIDRRVKHRAKCCPDCGGRGPPGRTRRGGRGDRGREGRP